MKMFQRRYTALNLVIALAISLLVLSKNAFAQSVPDYVMKKVPDAQVVGIAMFTYLFWDVYDATLYAPQGKWQPEAPFALKLDYQRDLDGKKIAQRSVDEMRKQGISDEEKLSEWEDKMIAIFPDVEDGDVITGVATASHTSEFYINGELAGSIEDTDFTQAFFDIWLSENTSEPKLRKALLKNQ
ncbi:chalcone isomerase family protein [Alteromonas sp. 1_MG-2023]|uniref:chalcone isomerase family protein n=1 Tax=Alteromonas sp. 1_MG-2023 TaxID=3062669 RepID=UPI0026E33444|nr:chalcone isomerase family protein [Alteromonas sp. 1_MG-2023]MDO6568381.1 chalcone isomerase family protein [Alteromonas sp. 1_MG-2023]